MKNSWLISYILLAAHIAQSQDYYNVVLPRATQHGFSHCAQVIEGAAGFWATAHQYHPETNNGVSTLVKLSESGDTILTKKITTPIEVTYGARIAKSDDVILVAALYQAFLNDTGRILLVCFNFEGEELWREIFTIDVASSSKVFFSEDGHIMIAGTSYNPNPELYHPTQFYSIKCNLTDRSVIWPKKIIWPQLWPLRLLSFITLSVNEFAFFYQELNFVSETNRDSKIYQVLAEVLNAKSGTNCS